MGLSVVKVTAGGLPVTIATTGGLPCTEATNGFGVAVTQSPTGGGLAVTGFAFGPTIALSASSVLETAAVNTTVGTLSVTSGTTGTPVFTLVDSAGGKFNILGTALRTNAALDYETATSHSITVAVSGVTPAVANRAITISVINVDDTSPVITSSNTVSNLEGTVLAHTLTANETVTWTIVGGADQARFELSGSTLRWLSNGVKDFEAPNDSDANNAYVVNVVAVDTALNTSPPQIITVTVTDVLGVAPAAPVLDLLTDGTDNTPDFTLTGDLVLGDTVRFQYSTSAVFSGASEVTNAIDAGEDAANAINFSTGSLANATWYFRARIERPGTEPAVSDWSNTETVTISVVVSGTTVFEESLTEAVSGNWGSGYTVVIHFAAGSLDAASGNEVRVTVGFREFSAGAVYELWFGRRNMSGDPYDFTGNQVNIKFGGNSTITGNGSTLVYVSDWVTLGEAYSSSADYCAAQQMSSGTVVSAELTMASLVTRYYGAALVAATTDKSTGAGPAGLVHFVSKIEIR